MTIGPPGTDPSNDFVPIPQEVSVYGDANGTGQSEACTIFTSASTNSPDPASCVTPADATITMTNDHLALIETSPAGTKTPYTTRAYMLWYPEINNTAEGVNCRLPSNQRSTCQAILDEALARQRAELDQFARQHPQPPATTEPTPTGASGLLAEASNGVLFIQWTLTSTEAQGTLTEAYTDTTDPTKATTESHPFHGIVSGKNITITLNDGTNWNGTLDGKNVTLSVTAADGTVRTFTFTPGTTTDYNAAVAQIKGGAAAAQGAKQTADATAKAQAQLDQDAATLTSDISALRAAAGRLTQDLAVVPAHLTTMRRDLAIEAAHLRALLNGGSLATKCSNGGGYQVSGTDAYQVTSTDDYQITSTDDYAITNDLSDLRDGIDRLNRDSSQQANDQASLPGYTPPGTPDSKAIQTAITAAGTATAQSANKRAGLLATVKQIDAQANRYATQADNACNNAGG
jgi:hypothetical protein